MLDQSKGRCDNGACCIDTYRILDSCRTQECMEDLRVFVTDRGQQILDAASAIRVKHLKVLSTRIETEEMPFNKGYYQIRLRYYFRCILDCCTGLGTGQDVAGLCAWDKSVLLYGGEGGVSIFRSDGHPQEFCAPCAPSVTWEAGCPRAVVEIAEPVALRLNVLESCGGDFGVSVIDENGIPEHLCRYFEGSFTAAFSREKTCFLSMGIFSIIRLERPCQLVIPACDLCIPPEKENPTLPYSDPCALFRSMEFPVGEFFPEKKDCCQ